VAFLTIFKHVDFGMFSLFAIASYECSFFLALVIQLLLLGEHFYTGNLGIPGVLGMFCRWQVRW
jgi:hypothetical protein